MNIKEKYILQDAAKKLVSDEYDVTKADMKAYLLECEDMTGTARAGARIGRFKCEVVLVDGRTTLEGDGDGFLDFLDEKGMVTRSALPEWREHAEATDDGRVIWRETGEVIPGAYVKRSASYPRVSGYKRAEIPELLDAAREAGLMGGELPLLGGVE